MNTNNMTRKEIDFIVKLKNTGMTDKQVHVVINDLVAIAQQQQRGVMA